MNNYLNVLEVMEDFNRYLDTNSIEALAIVAVDKQGNPWMWWSRGSEYGDTPLLEGLSSIKRRFVYRGEVTPLDEDEDS